MPHNLTRSLTRIDSFRPSSAFRIKNEVCIISEMLNEVRSGPLIRHVDHRDPQGGPLLSLHLSDASAPYAPLERGGTEAQIRRPYLLVLYAT